MTTSNNIIPKPCNYNCGTRIYWNTLENAYFEVFSGNRHQCPNRQQQGKKTSNTITQLTTTTKPNYYYKKPYYATQQKQQNQQPKPKMSNSLELLQGDIADVQKKYEFLSDIVSEANGKVHGSQSHLLAGSNSISLIVYYEIPDGQRDEIKHMFNSYVKNSIVYNSHQ
jgi:hypothetical protein